MKELASISNFYKFYEINPAIMMVSLMVVFFFPTLFVVRKLFNRLEKLISKKSNKNYSAIFVKHKIASHIAWVFVALYLMFWGNMFDTTELVSDKVSSIIDVVLTMYIVITITGMFLKSMDVVVDIYKTKPAGKKIAIELHINIIKIAVTICASLTLISIILGVSITSLFASIGAATALLTFVFKDTIIGLVTGLQLTFQDIIRIGDWVTLPKYDADGNVEKITVTVVVIRNFDNTYTTLPTAALLSMGVRNWRPMFERGGRRIKRSINIDMDTIKICDQKMLDTLKTITHMADFKSENQNAFDVKNGATNLLMFRNYMHYYLKAHQAIHQKHFTFLVRELDPTPHGIPIEMYIFTKDTDWASYERTQADILDNFLGMMPTFGLKPFQTVVKI